MKITQYLLSLLLIQWILLFVPISLAQNKIIVVPLGSNEKPLKNIVTVAKKNGDFSDPVAAINSITGASQSNPYLLFIAPGVFSLSETLIMKEYVHIQGSGEGITTLTAALSSASLNQSASVVSGANNSQISNLSVINTGGGANSYAMYNFEADTAMRDITINSSGSTTNYGIYNESSGSTMTGVTIMLTNSGSNNYGLYLKSSTTILAQSTIGVSGASGLNVGIAITSGGSDQIVDSYISATAGIISYGITNSGSYPTFRGTNIHGGLAGLINFSGVPVLRHSTISGSIDNTAKCIFSDDELGNILASNCQ